MSSIMRYRVFVCALAVATGAPLGCRPSGDDSGGDRAVISEQPAAPPGAASLHVGDPAPPLSIDQWVTGDPIATLQAGQIYVVEFWATWCPPCRASMPHLSKLQQEYGDQVQFIGVTDETEPTVQEFLETPQSDDKTWAEVVTYRLAIDADGATNAAYMEAAGQSGIPTAFIVGGEGLLEWIGHPMMMDEPLARIVAGDWDREAAMVQSQQREQLKQNSRKLSELVRHRRWDEALAELDQLEADLGSSSATSKQRLSILHQAGRTEAASAVRAELIDLLWNNATALNELAWEIATTGGGNDLDSALKAAQRASELRDHQDAAILDTLARVYYERGQLDEAIQWQRRAVEYDRGTAEIVVALEKYEAEKAAQAGTSDPHLEEKPAD